MSWPIGRGIQSTKYVATAAGGLFANGVSLTDADGWIVTFMPMAEGMPEARVSARIRCVDDGNDAPFFYVEDVVIAGRRYHSVYAAIVDGHEQVAVRLAACVQSELTRRASKAASGSHVRVLAPHARRAAG